MIPAEFRESGLKDYGPPHSTWRDVVKAWDEDEFALDPTRLTLLCGEAGFDGTQFKGLLAERFDIQINKTSRNSVLVQININNTRGDAAHLIKALADLSREIDDRLARDGARRARRFRRARQEPSRWTCRTCPTSATSTTRSATMPRAAPAKGTCGRRSSRPMTRRTANTSG